MYHIVKFRISFYGGAEGGAPLLNTQMNIRFRKTRFFDLKIAYECDKRPTIALPCMPKVAPPIRPAISSPHHPPPHDRPTSSLKNMGFSQKWGRSARYVGLQRVTAPMRPPHVLPLKSWGFQLKFILLWFSVKMRSLGPTDLFPYITLDPALCLSFTSQRRFKGGVFFATFVPKIPP